MGERLEDRCGGGNLFDGESFIETAIAQPVDFFNFNLHRNALFHRLNVADDADNLAAGVERVQRIQRGIQGFAVQRAEALIEKQRVYPRFVTHQVGQRQRQREANEEALATGKGSRVAHRVRLPGIDHFQLQGVAGFALQQIAAVQAVKLVVGQPYQVIQRQALRKLTEFVALSGTDKRIQPSPVFHFLRSAFHLLA